MMNEQEMLRRIENLERLGQRTRILFIAVVLGLLLIIAGVAFVPAKTIRAKELILTDSSGNALVRLSNKGAASCLELGVNKATAAQLCAGAAYGSTLSLTSEHYTSKVLLSAGAAPEGGGSFAPGLTISENGGRQRFMTSLGDEMKISLGKSEDSSSFVVLIRESQPVLIVTGPTGKAIWAAPAENKISFPIK
jgi:hypothetical protein